MLSMTRDSVAAGDDYDAPHTSTLKISAEASPMELCVEILSARYLPNVSGGRATWLVRHDRDPIGVIAQEWDTPRTFAGDIHFAENSQIHCEYHAQHDPDSVFSKFANSFRNQSQ